MDVDLSTNLRSFLPLVAPLATGHSDLSIGSRLLKGATVTRQWKREVISRCYNLLVKAMFGNHFSDAQCGFKAIKGSVVQELVPQVEDGEWFFDTELLLLAEEQGYRVYEIPVDWIEDLDSRVDVASTAIKDIKGLLRVRVERLRRLSGQRIRDVARRDRSPEGKVPTRPHKADDVLGGTPADERKDVRGEATTTVGVDRAPLPYSDDS
jgi:hypothetical protein